METAASTERQHSEFEALVARLPGFRSLTGSPVAEVHNPHFQAEDELLVAARALVAAFTETIRTHAFALNAAKRSLVGPAAERIVWAEKAKGFQFEEREAKVTLQGARATHEWVTADYNELLDELSDHPMCT